MTVAADLAPGRAAADRQVPRLRLVARALAAGDPRPGRAAARRGASTPAGTGCSPTSARTSTTSGSAPTSRSRATRSCSRPFASRCSTACRRRARAEQRAIAGEGPDRTRATTATRSGTPRAFVLPRAHLHRARRGRATRCAGATRRSTSPASAPASSASTGAAFPWRTIDGEECSGYWPAGTAAFHVNADIADAVVRYQAAADDDAFERERRRRAPRRDRAAVALARPPRRAPGASASTA